jgi:4-hydroxybenzoate polyprenyltransferase
MPIASSLAHFIGGLLHFLLGYTLFAPFDDRGLVISFFFALTFTAGHLNHEVHDFDFDRQNNLMTNAVAFGKRPVFIGSFILFTLAYGYVFLIAMQGMVPRFVAILCIALYPLHLINAVSVLRRGLTPDAIRQFRAGYRLIYALIGITILFAVSIR